MVLSRDEAAGLIRKWQEEEAQILAVSESPFQQSRRGTVEQHIDWRLGLQGKVALDQNGSGEKACSSFAAPFSVTRRKSAVAARIDDYIVRTARNRALPSATRS